MKPERAILVGVVFPRMSRTQAMDSLDELALLADTAGAVVIDRFLQDKKSIDPATFIGRGKVHQLKQEVIDQDVQLIIFDEDLTPVQIKNLEKAVNRKIIDRSGLILDIFARRARTREAQTQVELAQLQYLLPRLTRQWSHLSRQEGGIGTRGPGETQLEVDRRLIRKRIDRLRQALKKIEQQRNVRRKRRWDFVKIALVGYTNAGKSSLLNSLADADVFVEDRLFATLDAAIRTVTLDTHQKVLMIDTVGFIRKLPHHLVASFRSTLEETVDANILLHVVDVSHPRFEDHIGSVHEVLKDLGIHKKPTIMVFNKIDLISDPHMISDLLCRYAESAFTSAVRGIGLESLKGKMLEFIHEEEVEGVVKMPAEDTKSIAVVYDLATVLNKEFMDGTVVLQFRGTQKVKEQIRSVFKAKGNDYIMT